MNKLLFAILCAGAVTSHAAMRDYTLAPSLVTTNSESKSFTLRGSIEGVYVDVAATKTNVISITTAAGQTILSATVSSDTYFPVRSQIYNTSGSAITFIGGGATNDTANVWYDKIAVAGVVTLRAAGADGTTGTNAVSVKLIWNE